MSPEQIMSGAVSTVRWWLLAVAIIAGVITAIKIWDKRQEKKRQEEEKRQIQAALFAQRQQRKNKR